MDKTIADVDRIITLRLKALKKEYYFKYGDAAPKWYQKEAHRLEGIISALAWVKVFAIDDKHYNLGKQEE